MARTVQLLRHDAYCPILNTVHAIKAEQPIRFENFAIVMINVVTDKGRMQNIKLEVIVSQVEGHMVNFSPNRQVFI